MPRDLEIILRRSIALEHPRWTWDKITTAVHGTEAGKGPSALCDTDLLAAGE